MTGESPQSEIVLIDAPSVLGLRPSGVEQAPAALRRAGLPEALGAAEGGAVETLPYSVVRDPAIGVLNADAIQTFSIRLADALVPVLHDGGFPLVLGGDCSIVIGAMLALRRAGRYGLFFINGHADFYQPEASPTGEAADMDLALVTGRGPDVLTDIEGLRPLVRDEDVVAFGRRDADEAKEYGSQDIEATGIHVFDLAAVRSLGTATAATRASSMMSEETAGFWIHLDVDVLDDAVMPAVDYRMPGGLSFDELSDVLALLRETQRAVGMSLAIFNPTLDRDGAIAAALVRCIARGLRG